MTGDQEWKRIFCKGRSHETICPGPADGLGNVPVGGCLTVWDIAGFSEYLYLER